MMPLAWRQYRAQFAAGLLGLGIVAVAVFVTGPHLRHVYDTDVVGCQSNGDCPDVIKSFLQNDVFLQNALGLVLIAAPAIIGIFWGAPLVARELENGTFRLIWTQSITRTHWLAVKLVVSGVGCMAVAGLMSWAVSWWYGPTDLARMDRFSAATFSERGIVAIGYAAFAFAVTVLAGVLIRRTLPAMAIGLAVFTGVRIVFTEWIRQLLMSPVTLVESVTKATFSGVNRDLRFSVDNSTLPNAWIYSSKLQAANGSPVTSQQVAAYCPNLGHPNGGGGGGDAVKTHIPGNPVQDCIDKLAAHHVNLAITYQPAHRFWPFQWIECGIYVAAALALCGFAAWWIRRRLI